MRQVTASRLYLNCDGFEVFAAEQKWSELPSGPQKSRTTKVILILSAFRLFFFARDLKILNRESKI
jgi:hypothetical protein